MQNLREVALVGEPDAPSTRGFREVVFGEFRPDVVVAGTAPGSILLCAVARGTRISGRSEQERRHGLAVRRRFLFGADDGSGGATRRPQVYLKLFPRLSPLGERRLQTVTTRKLKSRKGLTRRHGLVDSAT